MQCHNIVIVGYLLLFRDRTLLGCPLTLWAFSSPARSLVPVSPMMDNLHSIVDLFRKLLLLAAIEECQSGLIRH